MEREYQARLEAQSRRRQRGVRESDRQSSIPQNDHGNADMGDYTPHLRPPPNRSVSDYTERTSTSHSTSSVASASTSTQTSLGAEAEHQPLSGIQESQSSQSRSLSYSIQGGEQRGGMREQQTLPILPVVPVSFSPRSTSFQAAVAGPSRFPRHSPSFAHSRLPPIQYEQPSHDEERQDLIYEPHTPSRLQGPGVPSSRYQRFRSTRPVGHRSVTEPMYFSSNMSGRGYLYTEDYSVDVDRATMGEVTRDVGGRPRARFSNVRGSGSGNRGRLESVRDQENDIDIGEQEYPSFDYESEWGRDKTAVSRFVPAQVTPIEISAVTSSSTALTRVFEESFDNGQHDNFARREFSFDVSRDTNRRGSGSYSPRVDPSAPLAHSSALHSRQAIYTNYGPSNDLHTQSRSRSRSPDAYPRIPSRRLAGPGVSNDEPWGRPSLRRRPASAPLTSIASQASTSPALSSNPGHGSGSNPHEGDVDVEGDVEMRASESDNPPPPSSISPASTAPPLPSSGFSEAERHSYQHRENTNTSNTGVDIESAAANPTDSHESNSNSGSALRTGALGVDQESGGRSATSRTGFSEHRAETRPILGVDRPHNSNTSTNPEDSDGKNNNNIGNNKAATSPGLTDEEREIEDARGRRRIRPSTPPALRVRRSVSANASISDFVESSSRVAERGRYVPSRSTYPTTPTPPFTLHSSTFSGDSRRAIEHERERGRDREWELRRHQPHEYAFVPLAPVQPSQHPYTYGYNTNVTPNQSSATLPPISSIPTSPHGPLPPPSALPLPLPATSERRRVVTAPTQSSAAESGSSYRPARTSAQIIDPSLRSSSPAASSSWSGRPIEREETIGRPTLSPLRPSRSSRHESSSYVSPRLRPVADSSRSRSPARQPPSSEQFAFSYPPAAPPSGSYLPPPHAPGYPPHPSHYPPPHHYYDRPPYNYHPQSYPYGYDYRHSQPHPSLHYEQEYGYYQPPPPQWEAPPMSSMAPIGSTAHMTHGRPWTPTPQAPTQHTISPSLRHAVARAREQESEGERERNAELKEEDSRSRGRELVERRFTDERRVSISGSSDVNVKDDSQAEGGTSKNRKGKARVAPGSGGRGKGATRGKSGSSKSRSGSRGRGGKTSSSTPRRSSKGKGKEKASPEIKGSTSLELAIPASPPPTAGPSRKRARIEGDGSVLVAEEEGDYEEGEYAEETRVSARGKRKARSKAAATRRGKERDVSGDREDPVKYRRVPRNKVQVACKYCRGRKMKCDGKHPCSTCLAKGIDCEYPQYVNRRGPGKKPKKSALASGIAGPSSASGDGGGSARTSLRGRQYPVIQGSRVQVVPGAAVYLGAASDDGRGFEYVAGAGGVAGFEGQGVPTSLPHPSSHPHGPPPAGQLTPSSLSHNTGRHNINIGINPNTSQPNSSSPTTQPGLGYPEHLHAPGLGSPGTGWPATPTAGTTGRSQRVPVVFTEVEGEDDDQGDTGQGQGQGRGQGRRVRVSASVSPRTRALHSTTGTGSTFRSGISPSSSAIRIPQQQQQFGVHSGTYVVGGAGGSGQGGPSSSSAQAGFYYGAGEKRKAHDDEGEADGGGGEGAEAFDNDEDDGGDELGDDEDEDDEDDDEEYRPPGRRSSYSSRKRR